ncbi:putative mitotic spindle assembly checkpoint protein MAD2B [Apostichopus japonicus]|uniref:Putative mitotic spindle assembly checkpoint protein MAD2B n=1 Tax=Stichopus japonicus TaxID=307972 RepID=A0A2G8KSW1_STIJA|nr:putative mitotic spindle assembly checkpoint protein MAD2B [Apostichopus japonicus]
MVSGIPSCGGYHYVEKRQSVGQSHLIFFVNSWRYPSIRFFMSEDFILREYLRGKRNMEFQCLFHNFVDSSFIHNVIILQSRMLSPQCKFHYDIFHDGRHPDLSKYISDTVQGIKLAMKKNEVQRVTVVILSQDRTPLERFVFEVAPVNQTARQNDDRYFVELEQSLKGFLLRINISDSMLRKTSRSCIHKTNLKMSSLWLSSIIDSTFNILVYTKGGSAMTVDDSHFAQEFPWMEAEDTLYTMLDPKLVPLKATGSGKILKMQLYVEEKKNKSIDVS